MQRMQSELLPLEEREATEQTGDIVGELQEMWGCSKLKLSTHEAQIARTIVAARNTATAGFESVGGHDKVKHELRLHVVVPLTRPSLFFSSPALRPPPGLLLEGPPGTGKTMLANALAKESKVPFIPVSLTDVENKWYGESQKLLRAVFSLAEKLQPCIIWVDEIDGLMRQRCGMDANHEYGLKTTFLQLLDRIKTQKIVVVAATNCCNTLDPALRRRLPRTYTIGPPDEKARREILSKLLQHEHATMVDVKWLVQKTDGFTGSDLAELYRAASAVRNETLARDTKKLDRMELTGSVRLPKLAREHWEEAMSNE